MQSQSAQLINQNDNSQDTASQNAYTQASSASNLHINDLQCNANIASGNAIDTRAQTACANFNENRFSITMSSNNTQIYMPNNYPSAPHVAANPFIYNYQQKPANSANASGNQVYVIWNVGRFYTFHITGCCPSCFKQEFTHFYR